MPLNLSVYNSWRAPRAINSMGFDAFAERQEQIASCTVDEGYNSAYCTQMAPPHMPSPSAPTNMLRSMTYGETPQKPRIPIQPTNGFDERVCLETCLPQAVGDWWALQQCSTACQNAYPDASRVTGYNGAQSLPKDYLYYSNPSGTTWPYHPYYGMRFPTVRVGRSLH